MATPVKSPARPAVIRVDPLAGRSSPLMELFRALPAWIISAGVHGVLIVLFIVVVGDPKSLGNEKQGTATEPLTTKVEVTQKDVILTNVDEGLDPELSTNYDVNRIDDVSVPGPPDADAAVGIAGAPEGPPVTVPPPPGSGRGQGAPPIIPDVDGRALPGREIGGGYGSIRSIPGGFAGRSGATRKRMVDEGGGSAQSEAAVAKGLRWLALHQAPGTTDPRNPGGYWSLDHYHLHYRTSLTDPTYKVDPRGTGRGMKNDIAGTAFGVLPFLAAGITHKPAAGKKKADNLYVKTVARALNYLTVKQGRDGDFGGGMYAHGLATIAVCEAYGLTSDPTLKFVAQKAINFIVSAQDPAGGGWRYQPRQGGDTSVVGWQVMALKSGQMSGLNVPNITLKGAEKWLDSCETSDRGGYGYTGPQETATMTAVGLLCRQYLSTPRRNPGLKKGADKLMKVYTPAPTSNIYYEYYATQVMHHMGGDYWEFWNKGDGKGFKGMRDMLLNRQDKVDGSWSPRGDPHAGAGGRIMTTSLSLLTLEVYYRHLPLYRR